MKRNIFPWRIFWRSFFAQSIGFGLSVFIVFGVGFWFLRPTLDTEISKIFDRELIFWILKVIPLFLIYISLVSLWISYRMAYPIGQVLWKAKTIAFKKLAKIKTEESDDPSLYEEEPGEFFELENVLEKIGKKLSKKRYQLAEIKEETEALISGVGDAVVSVDQAQKIVFYNSQFATRFLNFDNSSQASTNSLNRPVIYLSEVLRHPEILDFFDKSLSHGLNADGIVKLAIESENISRYYSISVSPMRKAKSKEIFGAIGVFHDITDLKVAEQIRIDFVGNASHELRTPLTSIKGYVDTLKDDIDSGNYDQAAFFTNVIQKNVNRLMELVDDLLTISKLESSTELIKERIDLVTLTNNITDEFKKAIADKGQFLSVQIDTKELVADPLKVTQVLRNLISNAIKYVPEKGLITVQWYKNTNNDIVLSVKDNGLGIPEQHLPRLFERFYRIDRGRTRDAGGTGLGLSIVKHIMQNHGGTVKVKSQIGEGSEFICSFPQARVL